MKTVNSAGMGTERSMQTYLASPHRPLVFDVLGVMLTEVGHFSRIPLVELVQVTVLQRTSSRLD